MYSKDVVVAGEFTLVNKSTSAKSHIAWQNTHIGDEGSQLIFGVEQHDVLTILLGCLTLIPSQHILILVSD